MANRGHVEIPPRKLNLDIPKNEDWNINGIMLECYFEAPCEYAQSRGTLGETKWPFDVVRRPSASQSQSSQLLFSHHLTLNSFWMSKKPCF